MKFRLCLAALVVALSGCATATPGSEAVALAASKDDIAGCERLGEVGGDQNMIGGILQGEARKDALRRMKNAAYELGATDLLMLDMATGWAGANALGIAYRC